MKKSIVFITLVISINICSAQSNSYAELKNWIKNNQIVFNSPETPTGYSRFLDCNGKIAYRKDIGDTIIIYSRGGSIAEDIETLNESIKKPEFNIYRYPKAKQNNGTIMIQEMRKWVFRVNQDTLFLLDEHDDKKNAIHCKLTEKLMLGDITEIEFEIQTKENYESDYGFKPFFKVVFYKDIFKKSNVVKLDKINNAREEVVSLMRNWDENGKQFFEINLETHSVGKFIISEDFEFINTEKCF